MKRKAEKPSGHLCILPALFEFKLCKLREGACDCGMVTAGWPIIVPLDLPSERPRDKKRTHRAFCKQCTPEVLRGVRTEYAVDYCQSVGGREAVKVGSGRENPGVSLSDIFKGSRYRVYDHEVRKHM